MLGSASILFAVLVQVVFGDFSPRCRASSENTTSLEAVPSINGRYVVEYCFPYDPGYSSWEVALTYFSKASKSQCNRNLTRILKGGTHSRTTEFVNITGLHCSEDVCLSLPLDLVFRGCYMLSNKLASGLSSSEPGLSFHYLTTNITSPSYYHEGTVWVRDFTHHQTDTVSYYWDSMRVPITGYEVFLCNENVTQYVDEEPCTLVSSKCRVKSEVVVWCLVRASPGQCYRLQLVHQAPWTSGKYFRNLTRVASTFCQEYAHLPLTQESESWWMWAVVGGAAAAVLIAALVIRERNLTENLKRSRLLQAWLQRSQRAVASESSSEVPLSPSAPPAACLPPACRPPAARLLVMYAREEPHGTSLVDALMDLLELAAPGQVIDLHSSECIDAMSTGGPAWLRAALSDDTKIVLLQTPSLTLTQTSLDNNCPPELSPPLIPQQAVYSSPSYSDTILQYSVKLLADSHLYTDRPYHKYYLANVSEVPSESAPHVAPYRRYELPSAATRLLADLSDASCLSDPALSDKLHRLQRAAADFARYVRENPHYLAEQFVLL